jgi:hypothetical protein
MRELKKDEVKSVAQTEVSLCKGGLWGYETRRKTFVRED